MPKQRSVYIGIGSNQNSPWLQCESACEMLREHPSLNLVACSPWYRSKAIGPGEQPDYMNGAALLETKVQAEEMLDILQHIEHQHHRKRQVRWGPRTLDLDILLYDDHTIRSARLIVPHPQMTVRNFVLKPLLDITPELLLPDGRKIADILHIIGMEGLAQAHTLDGE